MKIVKSFMLCMLACLALSSCHDGAHDGSQPENSVYYWKTVLELDSNERSFLQDNNVKKAYVRFFDVVVDKSPVAMDAVVPNATLQVKDTLPVEKLIPTIYITVDALKEMRQDEAAWAEKIVERVCNMCSYNEFPEPKEIQLDCDWTESTDTIFFNLCAEVKKSLCARIPDAKLSSTIRLHQLAQTPPPVDYGVLMLYNTGSFENPEEENSILTVESVRPYVKYLKTYPMHLDYAFPIFSWDLVYRHDYFCGILESNTPLAWDWVEPLGYGRYKVLTDTVISGTHLWEGNVIRREMVSCQTIVEVKELIENEVSGSHSIILYSLDSKNISTYSKDEIKQIYQ